MPRKNREIINAFKGKYPTLWKLVRTTCETALELKAKKGALAFINNAIAYGMVAGDLVNLVNESLTYQGKDIETNKSLLYAAIDEEFKGSDMGIVSIILKHIVTLVFMNIGGGKALEMDLLDYEAANKAD